jgi:long-chain acyl-CoA synthetase
MECREIPFRHYEKITDSLIHTVEIHPDLPFLRRREGETFRTYTYQAVLDRVRRIGGYLKQQGLVAEERAAVLGNNSPEWIFCYLGILWAGGVVVPLDARATVTEWARLMNHSGCRFLFATPEACGEIEKQREAIPSLEKIIAFSGEKRDSNLPFIFQGYEGLMEPQTRERGNLAVILYTSGTTGACKGAMLTHGNLLANVEQCIRAFDMDETDRFLSVLPIHHAFESTGGLLSPMAAGASVTIARSLKSKELLEDLRDVRPTVFLLVPLFLEKFHQGIERDLRKTSSSNKALFRLLKAGAKICNPFTSGAASKKFFRPIRSAMGLDKLRILVSGGAPLPRPLSRAYELFGFPVCQGYGLSETAPVLSVNVPGRCRNESVGPPLSGVEVRILDPDPEGVGEIAVKGPNIMKGYYLNEQATRQSFFEGWFFTGDLGKMDNDGYLYVTGRKKSLIVTRGGKKISPEEIEEELIKSPFVRETVVVARNHPRTRAEEIHAIIHPDFEALDRYGKEKGITISDRVIQELLGQHVTKVNSVLSEYKRIRNFSVREEEFPKTTTQKIKRYLFEEGGIENGSSKI